jgi:hypothetical protein
MRNKFLISHFVATLSGVMLIITTLYAGVVRPAIRNEIRSELYEMRESIEFIRCQLRAVMTPDQRENAKVDYEIGKCERGKK